MEIMMNTVMSSISNHFSMDKFDRFFFEPESGNFTIQNGILSGVRNKPLTGQYFAITGSVLNNGVYLAKDELITLEGAKDEPFDGTIYRLIVPKAFVDLVEKIKTFSESREGKASSITSASFGVQSYSYATDTNGMRAGWQQTFTSEFPKYRRMFQDIEV